VAGRSREQELHISLKRRIEDLGAYQSLLLVVVANGDGRR